MLGRGRGGVSVKDSSKTFLRLGKSSYRPLRMVLFPYAFHRAHPLETYRRCGQSRSSVRTPNRPRSFWRILRLGEIWPARIDPARYSIYRDRSRPSRTDCRVNPAPAHHGPPPSRQRLRTKGSRRRLRRACANLATAGRRRLSKRHSSPFSRAHLKEAPLTRGSSLVCRVGLSRSRVFSSPGISVPNFPKVAVSRCSVFNGLRGVSESCF